MGVHMGDAVAILIIRRRRSFVLAKCAFFEVLANAIPPQHTVRRRGIPVRGGTNDATDIRLGLLPGRRRL